MQMLRFSQIRGLLRFNFEFVFQQMAAKQEKLHPSSLKYLHPILNFPAAHSYHHIKLLVPFFSNFNSFRPL